MLTKKLTPFQTVLAFAFFLLVAAWGIYLGVFRPAVKNAACDEMFNPSFRNAVDRDPDGAAAMVAQAEAQGMTCPGLVAAKTLIERADRR